MAIARYKDLCMDAGDPATLGVFWAARARPHLAVRDDGDGLLTGPTTRHAIWVSKVPEPRTVKNRVHLDVYARTWRTCEALGATVLEPQTGHANGR